MRRLSMDDNSLILSFRKNVTATATACTMLGCNLLMADLGQCFMVSSTGVV